MREPVWIEKREVVAVHSIQLALHGGSPGMRDETLLESALAKPKKLFNYEEDATLARLASSYASGIAPNHAFVDGNKRTALVVCLGFLKLNGLAVTASAEERYLTFLGLAAGEIPETQMTGWLERNTEKLRPAAVRRGGLLNEAEQIRTAYPSG